jgi:hypothetical protein
MKHFIFLVLLMPCWAWSASGDQLGDYVRFQFTYYGRPGFFEKTVTKYDSSTDSYLVHTKTDDIYGGPAEEREDWISASEIFTKERGEKMVAQCQENDGTVEKVQIGANSIDVCRIYFYKKTSYQLFGPFPIDGVVGSVNKDDTNVTTQLVDFRWGMKKQ